MKKRIALILMVICCLILTACTNKDTNEPKETAAAETEQASNTVATEKAEIPQQETVKDDNASEEKQDVTEATKAPAADTPVKETEGGSSGVKETTPVTPPPTVADDAGQIQADAQFGSPGIDD